MTDYEILGREVAREIYLNQKALAVLGFVASEANRGKVNVAIIPLCKALGMSRAALQAALDELERLGLCSTWVSELVPVCTLSKLSADRLKLKLDARWNSRRWVPEWKKFKKMPAVEGDIEVVDHFLDLGGDSSSIKDFESEDGHPETTVYKKPWILVGMGGTWRSTDSEEDCPHCRGLVLRRGEACAFCSRHWSDQTTNKKVVKRGRQAKAGRNSEDSH